MIDQTKLANVIRFLSADAIQKANSGHPGMPLGMADIATVLWREFLNHNPQNPHWVNRDRFILSNGHGSMLLYSLLHLTGYDLSLEDIKSFRQLHSKTPGHPEFGLTPGVETTTGPLGQGLANGVGMALAQKVLAEQFNKPDFKIVDHYTYVFVGDGCLMEGVSHEACSFAGTHGLSKLIVFWDNNSITIDGHTEGWFTEDVVKRFESYNWHVVSNIDGHSPDAIRKAIKEAQNVTDKPTIICCKTIIGFGAPTKCNSSGCHGSPLGDKEIAAMRDNLGWEYKPFEIPSEIYEKWDAKEQGGKKENAWQEVFSSYRKKYPDLAEEFLRRMGGKLPKGWASNVNAYIQKTVNASENIATRKASQNAINAYMPLLPELLGGSCDLTDSNLTASNLSEVITKENSKGNYLHYGVREFGMFAMMNGLSLHGGFIPYGGTFLVFVSYGHSAIRMAAMMKRKVIYIFSHDSIGLGEDGPTHQPVEQLAMLRATPNLSVWRPCDSTETAVAWAHAIERQDGPTALILTRQKVAAEPHKKLEDIKRGGYILIDTEGDPEWILLATGSEVELAAKVATKLNASGRKIRVVSIPSLDVFDAQDDIYKKKVLPEHVSNRVAIEAASSQSWDKYVGISGKIVGIDRYGESAPAKNLFEFFGFSEENIEHQLMIDKDR